MRCRNSIIAAVLLVLCGTAFAQGPDPAAACAALKQLQVPGVNLAVTKTEWVPAGSAPPSRGAPPSGVKLPAYCRIDSMIDKRTGAAGTTYGIGFAIALPQNWNGRFLLQGGGGLNGSVQPPIGASGAGIEPGLARGFAVASTDTGHEGRGGFDASFQQDQQASLDFAYVAIGRVAEIAKRIVAQHYGKPIDHSYFAGCSTGGREAMLMAERYPTYFDGVVAGSPAMRTSYSGIGDRWVAASLNEIAPKDDKGLPITRNALSDSDRKTVIEGLINQCDALDGVKDRMIFNQKACHFDPKTLVCKGAKADGCLSAAHAAALEKGFAGPKDSKGRQVYPGFFFDTGIASTQGIPGLLHGGSTPVGPGFTDIGMNVDAAVERVLNDPAEPISTTARWTNLNTFSGHGGKLIFYHGVSDPWFSALDTVDYYERMTKANGGDDKVRGWSRLYLVPGMGHCAGGPETLDSFDALGAVVRWVEQGTAPDSLTATGRAFPGRSRPLCAYPLHAQYKGQGNSEDAANFECRE
jgi:Tannase and feruloyl esterase